MTDTAGPEQPDTAQPGTVRPGTAQPGTAQPGTAQPDTVRPGTVVVVGTGLIGTSVALALREQGVQVWLADSDPAAVRLAADLGAGRPLPADGVPG
ncbi:MAG: 3-hydroxyacyl-CoA dehydrogenase NAD-binding domain-containing protein, partial [Streptosporangiaceae bacterium]